jgi:hypothetical protein
MVTRVVMTEESEFQPNKTMVSLPSTRRLMQATMIGSTDEGRFRQGISLFPVLDSKVFLTTKEDLDAIFGKGRHGAEINSEEPGYCISIGKSAIFPDYEIYIDPDAFFGKHAAILGSTGSGKSCDCDNPAIDTFTRGYRANTNRYSRHKRRIPGGVSEAARGWDIRECYS